MMLNMTPPSQSSCIVMDRHARAPQVGYDHQSFSYRDLEGSKVHKALREAYGEAYTEGDVIGCLLHLPPGGRPLESTAEDVVQWKGAAYVKQEATSEPQELQGAFVGFSKCAHVGVAVDYCLLGCEWVVLARP